MVATPNVWEVMTIIVLLAAAFGTVVPCLLIWASEARQRSSVVTASGS